MEVIKFLPAAITEEERHILGQAIAICERVLANAMPVIEVIPDPLPAPCCLVGRGKLRLNGATES